MAIEDYTQAVGLNPELAGGYLKRAITYRGMERYDQAIADYNQVIDLDPENAQVYLDRASIYALLNNQELVEQDVETALALGLDRLTVERTIEAASAQIN